MADQSKNQNPGCLSKVLGLFGIKQKNTAISIPVDDQALASLPYRVRDDFLSPAEKSFYHVLNTVVGKRAVVCPKVNLADIFYVSHPNENLTFRGRIAQKHIDFLVCELGTMRPVTGVELDDRSHARADRQMRDDFVDKVFESAGLPLVRFATQFGYSPSDVETRIAPYLRGAEPESIPAPVPAAVTQLAGAVVESIVQPAAPFCPKCGERMVVRTAARGEHQGKQFYGCPNYPKCQQVLPLRR